MQERGVHLSMHTNPYNQWCKKDGFICPCILLICTISGARKRGPPVHAHFMYNQWYKKKGPSIHAHNSSLYNQWCKKEESIYPCTLLICTNYIHIQSNIRSAPLLCKHSSVENICLVVIFFFSLYFV